MSSLYKGTDKSTEWEDEIEKVEGGGGGEEEEGTGKW